MPNGDCDDLALAIDWLARSSQLPAGGKHDKNASEDVRLPSARAAAAALLLAEAQQVPGKAKPPATRKSPRTVHSKDNLPRVTVPDRLKAEPEPEEEIVLEAAATKRQPAKKKSAGVNKKNGASNNKKLKAPAAQEEEEEEEPSDAEPEWVTLARAGATFWSLGRCLQNNAIGGNGAEQVLAQLLELPNSEQHVMVGFWDKQFGKVYGPKYFLGDSLPGKCKYGDEPGHKNCKAKEVTSARLQYLCFIKPAPILNIRCYCAKHSKDAQP